MPETGRSYEIRKEPFRLDGLTAVVTGASRGIGEGCAKLFARQGAHVVLVARDASVLAGLQAEIQADGGSAESWALDVTDHGAIAGRMAQISRLDVLLNNAGTNKPQACLDVDASTFDAVFNLNVRAAFFVAQAAAKRMVELGRPGSIIMTSSQAGHVGLPKRVVYCGTKFALEGIVKVMALELASAGIRVNSIAPTFVETPMTRPYFEDPVFREYVQQNIPLGRMASVAEVAAAALYLASGESAMVTGTSLLIDGGWTAK
ncbi:MAG: SDR family oxidoreductase [Verrucomicrobia bacterium]|nr:SDR family oxidoreductase [Verrucomicrobiota bacterium]